MLAFLLGLFRLVWLSGKTRGIVLENLALRQQLSIYKRKHQRPHLVGRDRWFWMTLPTVRLRVLFVSLVIEHQLRRVLHFGVTEHLTSEWTAQQMAEAFSERDAKRYVIRDRAVFFNQLGEIRDRSYENQLHRASGLNLLVAAIILWNAVYLQRAVDHMSKQGRHPAPVDLAHLSPLGWEHINLTGDYHWETSLTLGPDQFRPLRTRSHALAAA